MLRPALRLLKHYQIVVVADREFHSVELANWLNEKKVYFALCQKQGTYIKQKSQDYQRLNQLDLAPSIKLFLTEIVFTHRKGFGKFNLAAYWHRSSKKKADEGWYILTNHNSLDAALKAYLINEIKKLIMEQWTI